MNVTVATTPESEAQFNVQLSWTEIDKASEGVYRRLAQQQKVPGFRPGHAPRSIIERMFGRDALYEQAIDDLVERAVREKAKESELTLLASPHAHVHEINYGQEHEVLVNVPVLGKGVLADYHDIQITPEAVVVTEEDIDNIINRARDQMAEYHPVDRPAAMGDRVTVTMQLTVNEKVVSDVKDHDFDLTTDRTGLFTGMDEEIVGMQEGETKSFTTTLPADYPKAEMAGQPGNYVVTLEKVTIKQLPEIDEEFAKKAGQFASVPAMREAVRADLLQSRTETAQRKNRESLIEALLERLELSVPPQLVQAELEDLMREMEEMLQSNRMDLSQYLAMLNTTREDYSETMKPEAMRRIRQRRALELVAEREGLVVTDHDLQQLLDQYGNTGGRGRARIQHLTPTQRIAVTRSILRDHATKWLEEHLIVEPAAPVELETGALDADMSTNPADTSTAMGKIAEEDPAGMTAVEGPTASSKGQSRKS